jgi:hypothetical protein
MGEGHVVDGSREVGGVVSTKDKLSSTHGASSAVQPERKLVGGNKALVHKIVPGDKSTNKRLQTIKDKHETTSTTNIQRSTTHIPDGNDSIHGDGGKSHSKNAIKLSDNKGDARLVGRLGKCLALRGQVKHEK